MNKGFWLSSLFIGLSLGLGGGVGAKSPARSKNNSPTTLPQAKAHFWTKGLQLQKLEQLLAEIQQRKGALAQGASFSPKGFLSRERGALLSLLRDLQFTRLELEEVLIRVVLSYHQAISVLLYAWAGLAIVGSLSCLCLVWKHCRG